MRAPKPDDAAKRRYTVTYAVGQHRYGTCEEAIVRIAEAVAQMRREGFAAELLGVTTERGSGQRVALTARYAAPSKGTIGHLNWRASLPASGPPQLVEQTASVGRGRDDTAERREVSGDDAVNRADEPRLTETRTMLYLTYWKVNEEMPVQQRQEIAQRLTDEGLFPPENVELVRWDGTPDGWGIALWEAESHEQLWDALNVWRASGAPFFEETKTAPAAPVEEVLPQQMALVEAMSERE